VNTSCHTLSMGMHRCIAFRTHRFNRCMQYEYFWDICFGHIGLTEQCRMLYAATCEFKYAFEIKITLDKMDPREQKPFAHYKNPHPIYKQHFSSRTITWQHQLKNKAWTSITATVHKIWSTGGPTRRNKQYKLLTALKTKKQQHKIQPYHTYGWAFAWPLCRL
jgi:hypothetical protein